MLMLPVLVALYYHETGAVLPFLLTGAAALMISITIKKVISGIAQIKSINDIKKSEGLCAVENMLLAATNEGLGTVFHIPVADEVEKIKEIVGAPDEYEFTCLLTMGYPVENAFLPKQKEIHVEDRIHMNTWK